MSISTGDGRSSDGSACVNIVKHGYLFIKRPPKNGFIRFKSWHRRYFVLRDEASDHPSRLEMYQKEADFFKKQVRLVLNLDKVIHVGRAEDSKRFRQAFMVVCAGRSPILLAEDDAMYTNSWLLAVTLIAEKRNDQPDGEPGCRGHFLRPECRRSLSGECGDCSDFVPPLAYDFEDPFVRRYEVRIESTTTSRRNGIEGDYVLTIRPWGLSLAKPKSEDYVVNWPLGYIRKFKSESLPQSYYKKRYYVVTLELGRRCTTGEGILQFHTIFGKEIIADMNQAISRSMSAKMMLSEESVGRQRALTRSRPSLHGSSQGSYYNSGWRTSSKESSSSLNMKCSLSRQSSGGNTSASRFTLDTSPHSAELNAYHNGGTDGGCLAPHTRSPLKSDSSTDSRCCIERLRTSTSSLNSASSSNSSASAAGRSDESGQYVEAEFTEDNSTSRRASFNSSRRCSNQSQNEDKVSEERAAKAAAEGYIEVLPDIFPASSSSTICREADKSSSKEELMNIYHVMDFSKSNSCLLTPRQHSLSSLSLGKSEGRRQLRSPRSSYNECPDLEVFTAEMNASTCRMRKSSGSRLGKPPAPLPRPEHTITNPK